VQKFDKFRLLTINDIEFENVHLFKNNETKKYEIVDALTGMTIAKIKLEDIESKKIENRRVL